MLRLLIALCFIGPINKAAWLIGTWERETSKGTIYESWKRESSNELSGKSYMLKGKDTLIFETIRLTAEQHQLYYIPTVKNQNNGQPVRFALTKISDKQLVFENSEHDFPQIITYRKLDADSLIAEISGMVDERLRKEIFPMRKVH